MMKNTVVRLDLKAEKAQEYLIQKKGREWALAHSMRRNNIHDIRSILTEDGSQRKKGKQIVYGKQRIVREWLEMNQ